MLIFKDTTIVSLIEKIPDWLRWILALPAFVITYTVVFFMVYFIQIISGYMYNYSDLWKEVVIQGIQLFCVLAGLDIFYAMVPKMKFKISLILSILIALLCVFGIFNQFFIGYDGTTFRFWLDMIINLLTIFVVTVFNIATFRLEYDINKKTEEVILDL